MDRILIEGDGRHIKKRVSAGVFAIVLFLVFAIISFSGAAYLSSSRALSSSVRDMMGTIGPISGVCCLFVVFFQLYMLVVNTAASKTAISVYETSVIGKGIIERSNFSVQSFQLSFIDIKMVEILENKVDCLVIYTQYEKYTCYARNRADIRYIILQKINSH